MFMAIFTLVTSALMSASLFFTGASFGSAGTTREPKMRRLAIYTGVLAGGSVIALGILTGNPVAIVGGAGLMVACAVDAYLMRRSLKKIRGQETSWGQTFEYLGFQGSTMKAAA